MMDSIFDSVEDEDVEDHDYDDINHQLLVLLLVKLLWSAPVTIPRREKWSHQRLSWLVHVAKLQHEGEFERTYRMSLRAYNKLLDLLRDSITLDHSKAGGSDPILPELVVAIGLRWLAGGSYIDIRHAYGCSITSMFRLRTLFIDAILECESLNIVFPDTTEKIIEASLKFRAISSDGIMRGCIGAIDGLLAVTIRPSLLECGGNPGAYFSGHYMTFGLNVQAACDHDSCFIFFGVMAPGKCSDQVAFERTSLPDKIASFPPGFYLVGDAAYQVSDVMIVPFTGAQREDKTRDSFNFFLSQLRICIEMAFGLLQCKWAILRKPLTTSLHMSSKVLESCARLHNYCLSEGKIDKQMLSENDEDDDQFNSIQSMAESPLGWGYLPTVEPLELQPGTSVVRDVIVARLGQMGMHRPPHNELRRQLELHDINLM